VTLWPLVILIFVIGIYPTLIPELFQWRGGLHSDLHPGFIRVVGGFGVE
jgi:hypothetical protein